MALMPAPSALSLQDIGAPVLETGHEGLGVDGIQQLKNQVSFLQLVDS